METSCKARRQRGEEPGHTKGKIICSKDTADVHGRAPRLQILIKLWCHGGAADEVLELQ